MKDCIKDNVYVITGSAGGLGRAFAEKLLLRGAKVCLSDIKVRIT
jgi:NAD(P)-dependent dehydrogenase (short-subunit alcohol dehydrogenase family)